MTQIIDENNNIITTDTTWGEAADGGRTYGSGQAYGSGLTYGITLEITVPAVVQSGTLTLAVPSIAALTGAGSIVVESGASISIAGPTGTRTMTVQQGHQYKLDPSKP